MTALTWITASPDGHLLGIGSETGRFTLWSVPDAAVVGAFDVGDFVCRAAWTPDGGRLSVATLGAVLVVRSGDGGTELARFDTRHGRLRDLAVDPAGTRWATCGHDATARVWDAATLQQRCEVTEGKFAATSVGFAKASLVVGFDDGYFVAWRDDGSEKLASDSVVQPPVYSLGVHPSLECIVFGGGKGGMHAVEVGEPDAWKPGQRWKDTPPKPIAVNAISFAPDGRFVAAFSDDTAGVFASVNDLLGTTLGRPFHWQRPNPGWRQDFIVSGACFVPGSDLVATSHFDGCVRLWRGAACVETLRFDEQT